VGLELTATGERLAAFQSVQNTYLSIFQLLGGLGMLLGTVGLGVVVLRNAWERRGELAITRAVGFSERDVRRLLWREHALLLGLGLTTGLVAALVAVSPALQQGRPLPLAASAGWLVLLAASGAVWVWIASCISLRGGLLDRLRGE
jgi:ABC-type antimicrobial peptide transport system permease subunit